MRDLVKPRFDMRVHGHVGVDLLDHGHVVMHEEHDNYVSQRYLDFTSRLAQYGVVGLRHESSAGSSIHPSGWWNTSYGPFARPPFNGLQLTDYASPVDVNEECVHGSTLAQAVYGYSSSDSNRGTFNPQESYQNMDSFRFVYDFNTAQANGTFQSIYTFPTMLHSSGGFISANVPTATSANLSSRPTSCAYYDGNLYYLVESVIKILPMSKFMILANGQSVTVNSVTVSPTPTGITIKDGRLYWIGESQTISSAPLTDLSNVTTNLTMDSSWISTNGRFNRIVYSEGRNSFLLGYSYTQTSGKPELLELSTDFTIIHQYQSNDSFGMFIASPHDASVLANGYSYDLDEDNATATRTAACNRASNNSVLAAANIGDKYMIFNHPGILYLCPQQYYFSRARLDSPVTKTSQQTMKITYDFTLDPMDWDA